MPMKRLFFLTLFELVFLSIQAQISSSYLERYELIGRNLLMNCDITAFKESFGTKIYHTTFDSISNTALITLWQHPGAGIVKNSNYNSKVVYYDLEKQKIKWERSSNLNDDILDKMGSYIFFKDNNCSYLLDPETGKNRFKLGKNLDVLLYYVKDGWVLCATYNNLLGKGGSLQKINLSNNELIWKKDADLDYGLKMHGYLNDSIALFVGAGLRGVNLNTGSMWSYVVNTDKSDYLSYKTQLFVGVYSDVKIEDSAALYFAGGDKIVKLRNDGSVIWENELVPAEMSKSILKTTKDYLVLVNHGFSYGSSYLSVMGKPFFSVYDKLDGTLRCNVDCQMYSEFIIDAYCDDDFLYLIFQDTHLRQMIGKFRLSDGKLVARHVPTGDFKSRGILFKFIGPDVYARQDTILVQLQSIDSTGLYVSNLTGVIYLDKRFGKAQFFENEKLYFFKTEHEGLRFFSHDGKIVAVDAKDRDVATLDFDEIFVTESELYSTKDDALYIINKSQIPFVKEETIIIQDRQ